MTEAATVGPVPDFPEPLREPGPRLESERVGALPTIPGVGQSMIELPEITRSLELPDSSHHHSGDTRMPTIWLPLMVQLVMVPWLSNDLFRRELLPSWHLLPSRGLHHKRVSL